MNKSLPKSIPELGEKWRAHTQEQLTILSNWKNAPDLRRITSHSPSSADVPNVWSVLDGPLPSEPGGDANEIGKSECSIKREFKSSLRHVAMEFSVKVTTRIMAEILHLLF